MSTRGENTGPASGATSQTLQRPPRDLAELLDREEALAREGIADGIQRLGSDVVEAGELPARIREHPLASVALGALGGLIAGGSALKLFAPRVDSADGRAGAGGRRALSLTLGAAGKIARAAIITKLVSRFGAAPH